MKLHLPQVTLIALTSLDWEGHKRAIDKSCEEIDFGDVKLIWDQKIDSIDSWNYKVIYELWRYVQTDYAMLIHADGFIQNAEAWRSEFLDYDFIGSPWPLPQDDFSYRTPTGELVRVGNSVSIRSKMMLGLPYMLDIPWKSYYGNTNEDGFLCVHNREVLEKHGMKFAPLKVAKYFSKEWEIPENVGIDTFAFHTPG